MDTPVVDSLNISQFHLWKKLTRKRAPLGFTLELTARCNNDCRHCYINLPAGDSRAAADELTLEEILRIAGEAAEMGALWCLITGGEPLLRPDFSDVYLGLKRQGLVVSVFTNATLIRDEHVELFRQYPAKILEVTAYGVTEATYEAVTRRPGSFAAFRTGLDRLLVNGIPVRLKAMALRSNVHELSLIAEFCRSRTMGYYRFDPLLNLRFDRDPVRNAQIREERLSPDEIAALEQSDPERFRELRNHCDELIQSDLCHSGCDHLFHCGTGMGEFVVGYDGLFRLCGSLWAPGTTYDLRVGRLKQAWYEFAPQVRDLRSRNTAYLETCHACPIIDLCLSCPAHNYLETGEMDGETPYFCAVAHARAEMLKTATGRK
ncbi:MAG: radical SAM protein [Deltaproteobacteria bacterium]|nr:radical SAM protein [Deltaproteobacteria bacterium]